MIKVDIKMPKNCDECPLSYCDDWGKCCIFDYVFKDKNGDYIQIIPDYYNSRHPDCPLVEIKEEK